VFPPGHTYSSTGGLRSYYHPDWFGGTRRPAPPGAGLRERFEAAVGKRLMSDVPFGTFLSGGLDSSLVTAVAADLARRTGAGTRLPSFSIGTDADAPDLRMARAVAAHVGTDHHEVHFDPAEGIAALDEVIYYLESYDAAEIRGAVPMYLLMREIRARGVKVVLCGEGADEIFAGYLYFHFAKDADTLQRESLDLLAHLHLNDLQRVDKITMAHGGAGRLVPPNQSGW